MSFPAVTVAQGDLLEREQHLALAFYEGSKNLKKAAVNAPECVREEAERDIEISRAIAEEWGCAGSECR